MATITADLLRTKFGFNDPNVINNILNNPSEVARYTREAGLDAGYNAQQAAEKLRREQEAITKAQQARESEFVNRFRTEVPSIQQALRSELGIDRLTQNVQSAAKTASDVQGMVSAVAPTQQTIAKQVGISAPRLQQRISSKTAELAPTLESAVRGLSTAQSALESGLGTYSTDLASRLTPLTTEASMLSDSLAREMTGFTTQMKNELDITLEKLKQKGTLDLAELQKAQALAEKEKEYENQRATLNLGNRQVIINPVTGKEISSFAIRSGTGTLATGW